MKRAFLRMLVGQRASITQRWRVALQNAPVHTPLANPELLAYMMDETLEELLWSILYPKSTAVRNDHVTTPELTITSSSCGLNPYIGYFLAGEAALVGVIKMIEPTPELSENDILCAETELLFAFRGLGHREVNAFCEICQIEKPSATHGSGCTLPEACPYKNKAFLKSSHFATSPAHLS